MIQTKFLRNYSRPVGGNNRAQSEVAPPDRGGLQKLLLKHRHEACLENSIVLKPRLAESQKFNAE